MYVLTDFSLLAEEAGVVLIPLVPALILFALLPSKTSVGGPFKGLSVRLQGAFGGYFLLVLVLTGLVAERRLAEANALQEGPRFSVWTVRGQLQIPDLEDESLFNLQTLLKPIGRPFGRPGVDRQIRFEVDVPLQETGIRRLETPFSSIVFDHPELAVEKFILDGSDPFAKFGRDVRWDERVIQVEDVIELVKSPSDVPDAARETTVAEPSQDGM